MSSNSSITNNLLYYGASVLVNEGYMRDTGKSKSISGYFTCNAAVTNAEVCSIRTQIKNLRYSTIKFAKLSAFSTTSGDTGVFTVRYDPSYSGGTNSWTPVEDDSIAERYTGGTRTLTGLGMTLATGRAASHTNVIACPSENGSRMMIGSEVAVNENSIDVLSLTLTRPETTPCTFMYTMEWLEYY
jgi:hypothetical protein